MATPPPPPPPPTATSPGSHQENPQPHLHIKSAARKLPIKRNPNPNPNANPNPNPNLSPNSHSFSIIVDDGDDPDPEDFDDDDDTAATAADQGGNDSVPFKFHRIWSESDEVRFLQGLLACRSQALVFPRDLNVFFDRFSETMTQPYTRSQLSEKLRRLRKKFRVISSRVARGLDPSTALSSHDRDLYHLSTQLWHPSYADASPFVASGPDASKRRRRLPPPMGCNNNKTNVVVVNNNKQIPVSATAVPLLPQAENRDYDDKERVFSSGDTSGDRETLRHSVIKAVLDVLDSSVKEVQTALVPSVMSVADNTHIPGGSGGELLKRWQEQRAAELDVFARRLRLVIENGVFA